MIKHNYDFLNKLSLPAQTVNQLSSSLSAIERGNNDVLSSPLTKQRSSEEILSGWDAVYAKNKHTMNDVLIELEASNRSKFGPRSIAIPWVDRRDGVLTHFEAESEFRPPKVSKEYLRRNLRPIDVKSALQYIKNDTNSGLPFYQRKGPLKETYQLEFKGLLDRKDPCVMFTRTQEGKKTRTVWGYPMADVINEMRFYQPLLQYQRKTRYRNSLVSPEAVDLKMTKLITDSRQIGGKLLSIDFSAYDSSVKGKLQSVSFDYIKSLFQKDYEDELDYIANRFNNIGLITPDGILYGSHGVPSGSAFTNEVDSIAQYLIAKDFGLSEENFDIQGDDGAYRLEEPEKLMSFFESKGLNVNSNKSYIANDYLVYLQNLYHADYVIDGVNRGIYPTYRALNRIIFLERFTDLTKLGIDGSDYFSIRTISILENCKNHPLFRQLVSYVASLDKYSLQFSDEGLRKFVQSRLQSTGVAGILKFRYEDDIQGIKSFETFKILRELYQVGD